MTASIKMTGDWLRVDGIFRRLANKQIIQNASGKAFEKEAHRIRKLMIEAFNKGGPPGVRWKRLSVFTQLVNRALGKGDRKPLLDTGSLRNSVSVTRENDTDVFVGIHRNEPVKGDSKLPPASIAAIHEYGHGPISVKVTSEMRKFFMFLHIKTGGQIRPLKGSTRVIVTKGIPQRPFAGPILEAEKDAIFQNIYNNFMSNVLG